MGWLSRRGGGRGQEQKIVFFLGLNGFLAGRHTILEAKSQRVPIIASRVGGLEEIVHDVQTAIFIRAKVVEGIMNAIKQIMENPIGDNQVPKFEHLTNKEISNLSKMGNLYHKIYLGSMKGII